MNGVPFLRPFPISRPQEGGENMAEPGALEYFYGTEAEQYTFYRIPKGVVHRPRVPTDNRRRKNPVRFDVRPHGAFHTQRLAGRTKPGVPLLYPTGAPTKQSADLLLHEAAKRAFNDLGIKKLPTVKILQGEYADLLTKKKAAYEDFKRLRKESQELQTVKANVDALLHIEQVQDYKQEKE